MLWTVCAIYKQAANLPRAHEYSPCGFDELSLQFEVQNALTLKASQNKLPT